MKPISVSLYELIKFYMLRAADYRRALYFQEASPNPTEWKNAARRMTQLNDEVLLGQHMLNQQMKWLEQATPNGSGKRVRYERLLGDIRDFVNNLDALIPKVKHALGDLLKVAYVGVRKDIESTMEKVKDTETLAKKIRLVFVSLEKAIGL
ncbi:hypothetical protein ElyMa_002496800 [Elysia marginata]|uniref:Uncharacterized protein n=1 Tax=Elysia marginata TaxID=1093978 RepID=A0AAV4GR94_9GAST|nr:hypothetical protein ElyMa_002496800 [Elysia marginata]